MKRREFLQISAAGTLAVSIAGAGMLSDIDSSLRVLALPTLPAHLDRPDRIREIGRAYRTRFPAENSPEVLSNAILPGRSSFPDRTHDVLLRCIERNVRHDFGAGQTVQIDGWILSRTEARQCALFSILFA